MNTLKPKRGFTLIEVMVVVTVIGILAAVIIANFNEARMAARDDTRAAQLKEVQLALELYKAENGRYPDQGCGNAATGVWAGPGPATNPVMFASCEDYILGLAPDYIHELPRDQALDDEDNTGFYYNSRNSGAAYKLIFTGVESKLITSYEEEIARCPYDCNVPLGCDDVPSSKIYAVYSDGAQCW